MGRSSVSLKLGAVLLIVCLCDAVLTDRHTFHSRQKRGFRGDAATRVAHGFGKRGYLGLSNDRLSQISLAAPERSPSTSDGLAEGSIMTVDEFAQLLTLHPKLIKVLLRKFVDLDGDDTISTDELFRPVINK